jgi:HAD superfamily phosphatase (TIGR01668 family)
MLGLMTPDLYLNHVLELEPRHLRSIGVEGLLLDLDGTLKDYRAKTISTAILEWAADLKRDGFRLCLLSNGKTRRIERFAQDLGVPFVAKAFKPFPWGCWKALKVLGLDRSRVAIVGDQVFADILAGHLAGLVTVLVRPSHSEEPWFTRLKRPFERTVLRRLYARPEPADVVVSVRRAGRTAADEAFRGGERRGVSGVSPTVASRIKEQHWHGESVVNAERVS